MIPALVSITQLEFAVMLIATFLAICVSTFLVVGSTYWYRLGLGVFIAVAVTNNLFVNIRTVGLALSNWWMVIPMIVGALAFARMTRYRWASRYPVAIMSGVGAGIVFGLTLNTQILIPIASTVTDILTATPDPLSSWLVLAATILVPIAFTYSVPHSGWLHKRASWVITLGRTFFLCFVGLRMGELDGSSGAQASGIINFVQVSIMRTVRAIEEVLEFGFT
jgi:hypothetical protein